MKKLAFVLFGVLIGVIGSHLMNQNDTPQEIIEQNIMDVPDTEQSQLMEDQVPAKPKGLITPEEGKLLSNNYSPRHAIVSKALKMEDNRSVWFSIDELDTYIKYAKYETDIILKGENKMNGIRMYLGAYPDKSKEYDGYTTMFLVPTYDSTISKGNFMPFQDDSGPSDVPGGSPLNMGHGGTPPQASYPQ